MADALPLPAEFTDRLLTLRVPPVHVRVRWQPSPLAERHVPGRGWNETWPDFRILKPANGAEPVGEGRALDLHVPTGDAAQRQCLEDAFCRFAEEIPGPLRRIAGAFPSHQWALLKLMHAERAGQELAEGNPVLAYGLANSSELRRTIPEVAAVQAVMRCRQKQRAIAGWLGFPATEASVKLLRKIQPGAVSPSLLRGLREAMRADARVASLLAHLPTVGAGQIELVARAPLLPLVTPALLEEVGAQAAEATGSPTADILSGILCLRQGIEGLPELTPVQSIRAVRDLQTATDRAARLWRRWIEEARERQVRVRREQQEARAQAAERRRRQQRLNEAAQVFGPPPVPGTEDIVPLRSARELEEEGNAQHNCVGGYTAAVVHGQLYIYRVLKPERATLSIIPTWDRNWRISELKRARNHAAGPRTWQHVQDWLDRHRVYR